MTLSNEIKASHIWSYSNISVLNACPRKFSLKYIHRVKADVPDESSAFFFGTVFHAYLEEVKHESMPTMLPQKENKKFKEVMQYCYVNEDILDKVIKEELKNEKTEWTTIDLALLKVKVGASLQAYLERQMKSGLKWIASEVKLETPNFVGYVDVIFMDPLGGWWIADLKTASTVVVAKLNNTLASDVQLGIYASHKGMIAEKLGLDINKFAGVRYMTTTKTSAEKLKPFGQFCVDNAPKSYDFEIPVAQFAFDMNIMEKAKRAYEGIKDLDYKDVPCNKENCMSFFKPCVYWSYCHGRAYEDTAIKCYMDGEGYNWSPAQIDVNDLI